MCVLRVEFFFFKNSNLELSIDPQGTMTSKGVRVTYCQLLGSNLIKQTSLSTGVPHLPALCTVGLPEEPPRSAPHSFYG